MNELALFAGAGGGLLAGRLLGWRTVVAVERDAYAASVLVRRQNEGHLEPFPVWADVLTFDGRPWRGVVDVVSGGFPCQDISVAGTLAGLDGERSGLWREMARIVGEVRPRYVFVENSPMLLTRGLGTVLGDLAALGFDAAWRVLSAQDLGAPHLRERIWIVGRLPDAHNGRRRVDVQPLDEFQCGVTSDAWRDGAIRVVADPNCQRQLQPQRDQQESRRWSCDSREAHVADADRNGTQRLVEESQPRGDERPAGLHDQARGSFEWPAWPPEPDVGRVAPHGVAHRVDSLKAIGNGQVPRVAAAAFAELAAEVTKAQTEKNYSTGANPTT